MEDAVNLVVEEEKEETRELLEANKKNSNINQQLLQELLWLRKWNQILKQAKAPSVSPPAAPTIFNKFNPLKLV